MPNISINQAVAVYLRKEAGARLAYTHREADAHDKMRRERRSQLRLQVGTAALIELGTTTLDLLTWLATDKSDADKAVSELNVENVRATAISQLSKVLEFLSRLACQTEVELNPRPIDMLTASLCDLEKGFNSRLLVTGALTDRVLCGQYTYRGRIMIQGRAAAAVEHLLRSRKEKSQMAAARRVARALKAGGYSSTGMRRQQSVSADTVKRWHNAALPNADAIEFCLGCAFDLYMHIDAVPFRRRLGLDPNSMLEDLAEMCQDFRMPG